MGNVVDVLVRESGFDKHHSFCSFSIPFINLLEKVIFVSPTAHIFGLSIHSIWNLSIDHILILGISLDPPQKIQFLCEFLFFILVFYVLAYYILLL